jgi:hypothetical protein
LKCLSHGKDPVAEERKKKRDPTEAEIQNKVTQSHQEILETIKEFKLDYLDNEEKKRKEKKRKRNNGRPGRHERRI